MSDRLEAQTDAAAHEVFAMPEVDQLFASLDDAQLLSTKAAAQAAIEVNAQALMAVITAKSRREAIDELKISAMAAVSTMKVIQAEQARRQAG